MMHPQDFTVNLTNVVNETQLNELIDIIQYCQDAGYEFVTFSQLTTFYYQTTNQQTFVSSTLSQTTSTTQEQTFDSSTLSQNTGEIIIIEDIISYGNKLYVNIFILLIIIIFIFNS